MTFVLFLIALSLYLEDSVYVCTPIDITKAKIKLQFKSLRQLHSQYIQAYTESIGNSPSLILYFIKNSNCATRLTVTHVLHT